MNAANATRTIFLSLSFVSAAVAQTATPAATPATAAWQSARVVYVAGLSDVKPNTSGSLQITQDTLLFTGKTAHGQVPLDRITAVFTGDERVATGGTGAKVARMVPVFGFGAMMGAVTNKSVDLLTVEYTDGADGVHGAVFELPKTQATLARQQLVPFIKPAGPLAQPRGGQPCAEAVSPRSIVVVPIVSSGLQLPAEYRVLLYEQLVTELQATTSAGMVHRVGDMSASCSASTLRLSVTAFKKGNEALRASTGPVGLFVGSTSVNFEVTLLDKDEKVLFQKSLKTRKHGDADSLGVTRDLAKSVSKRLAKAGQTGQGVA